MKTRHGQGLLSNPDPYIFVFSVFHEVGRRCRAKTSMFTTTHTVHTDLVFSARAFECQVSAQLASLAFVLRLTVCRRRRSRRSSSWRARARTR